MRINNRKEIIELIEECIRVRNKKLYKELF